MNADGTVSYSQPKSGAAARPLARSCDAVERTEKVGQLLFRNTRTMVADGDDCIVICRIAAQGYLD